MSSRFARIFALAILLLAVGETLLAHWLSLAWRGRGLGVLEWFAGGTALIGLNYVLFPLARRRMHGRGAALVASRTFILGSVGALLTGILLAFVFILIQGGAWVSGTSGSEHDILVWTGGLVIALGFGAIAWGASYGQSRIQVDRITLPIHHPAGQAPEVTGLQIAHITDLHIGPLLKPDRLRVFVDRINQQGNDIVAITGDIFDFDPAYIADGCRELARLEARYGVFAVLGNHDVYTGTEAVAAGLAEFTAIRLLRNEWEELALGETGGLIVAGIEDDGQGWTERESENPVLAELAAAMPRHLPSLLLAHRPAWFSHAARLGFDAVLAGHTHGGQVAFPGAPHQNLSRMIANRTRGVFTESRSAMYVSRGLGVAGLPLRIGCPREIALIRLQPANP